MKTTAPVQTSPRQGVEDGAEVDVFVSYADEDRDRIVPVVQSLIQAGLRVWWDRRIPVGAEFDREIQRALDRASSAIVFWTEHSVASHWVRAEASAALQRGVLIQILLDGTTPPPPFGMIQGIVVHKAATTLVGSADFEKLLEAIAALSKRRPSHVPG